MDECESMMSGRLGRGVCGVNIVICAANELVIDGVALDLDMAPTRLGGERQVTSVVLASRTLDSACLV